jgi:thiamine pyrophosphate-dependent acetolactate synthase large subunit-like protein
VKETLEDPAGLSEDPPDIEWASDALAELLRRLEVPFISLNPGASYRGLHDSLVNYLGNDRPRMIVCLHEEHAVAVAHGYAKVTGEPMAVALHSNVGLMHATMALYTAFCDRVPMLVLGATGPVDAAQRRPWIDWIHTSADQGALIRSYVKFDDQPASLPAALESLLRAHLMTRSYPAAPTYICLDSALQESEISEPPRFPELERFQAPAPPAPSEIQVTRGLELLHQAAHPVLLVGRVGRSLDSWDARVALAQRLGATVLTDLKTGAVFPSDHPLHPAVPGTFLTTSGRELLAGADVVLALDWIDLGGTLRQAEASPTVIACTADQALHNGWSKDHFGLAPVDLAITAHPDLLVDALLTRLGDDTAALESAAAVAGTGDAEADSAAGDQITIRMLARSLHDALAGGPACLVRLPLGWDGADLHLRDPLDYLGQDGGAGLGSGPGMTVGAALALDGSPRLAVGVLGDGDTLMGASALWTAAHYGLGMLVVVANNRSFFNDEVHQERVARRRGRPVANRWVGQHIRDPEPDLAALARSLGLVGYGPVGELQALDGVLAEAVAAARDGASVLVDVHVASAGYPGGVSADGSAVTIASPAATDGPATLMAD